MSDPATPETGTSTATPNSNDPAAAAAAAAAAGGAAEKPFYDGWSDDLKTSQIVLRHKTPEEVARSLVAAEKRLGVPANELLRLPKGPDDKEGAAALYKALGAPETVDGYKFDLAEGTTDADKAAVTKFVADMHAAGPVPPAFIKGAVEWFTGEVARQQQEEIAAAAAASAAGEAALKTEWGGAFEQRKTEIGKLLADHGGQELADELTASPWGDHPKLAIFLGKILDKMAEPGPNGDGQRADVGRGVLTPGQATAARLELEEHPAFLDRAHALHKDIIQRRDALLAQEHPNA